MFKKIVVFLFLLSTLLEAKSQLFNATFTGSGCPTPGNSAINITNAAVTAFTRVGLTCVSATNALNSTASWSSAFTNTQYVEVTITANTGYTLNLSNVTFDNSRSATGPVQGRIAHNGNGSFSTFFDFNISTTNTSSIFDFPDFSSTAAGSVTFRIYAWSGSSGGTMRFSNFSVYGSVTPSTSGGGSTPFTYDIPNSLVGLGKTPTQKFDVDGNIRTSGKLLVGSITDADVTAKLTNYSLAVNGNIIANQLVVKVYPWPDYVFDKGYRLRSLQSLEAFIKANKHLPDVPSVKDVTSAGVDVGVTQAALLRKIEELTLYVIKMNQRIQKLEAKQKVK